MIKAIIRQRCSAHCGARYKDIIIQAYNAQFKISSGDGGLSGDSVSLVLSPTCFSCEEYIDYMIELSER